MTTDQAELTPRQILDPEGTLPDIELVDTGITNERDPWAKTYEVRHGDQNVGAIVMTERDGEKMIKRLWIRDGFTGTDNGDGRPKSRLPGIGMSIRLAGIEVAQSEGKAFRTEDERMSPAIVRGWQKLISAGVAEVIEDFKFHQSPVSYIREDTYTGYVRVPYPFVPSHRQRRGDVE